MTSLLDYALLKASQGFRLLHFYPPVDGKCPCPWIRKRKGNCPGPGKHPISTSGSYYAATSDLKEIRRRWTKFSNANIGLATGQGLLAFDPDGRNGGDIILKDLEATVRTLPSTWRIQSGSGDIRQVFSIPADLRLKTKPYRPTGKAYKPGDPQLDVIAEKQGLIIAGMHWTGNPYVDLGGEIAPLPEEWIEFLLRERYEYNGFFEPGVPKDYIVFRESQRTKEAPYSKSCPEELHAAKYVQDCIHPGVPFPEEGKATWCLVHPDGESPGCLWRAEGGYMKFHCFHLHEDWSVTDLYAVHVLKGEKARGKAFAKLRDQLYLESGARVVDVPHKPLWEGVRPSTGQVYVDFLKATALNWVSFPGHPTMYATTFGAKRTGLSQATVQQDLHILENAGRIVPRGSDPRTHAKMYLPVQPEDEAVKKANEAWVEEQFKPAAGKGLADDREKNVRLSHALDDRDALQPLGEKGSEGVAEENVRLSHTMQEGGVQVTHCPGFCRCGCRQTVVNTQIWATPGCKKRAQRAIAAKGVR